MSSIIEMSVLLLVNQPKVFSAKLLVALMLGDHF